MSEFECSGDPADGCEAKEIIASLQAKLKEAEKALDSASSGIWDGYYGRGLTLDCTRALSKEITEALEKIRRS